MPVLCRSRYMLLRQHDSGLVKTIVWLFDKAVAGSGDMLNGTVTAKWGKVEEEMGAGMGRK